MSARTVLLLAVVALAAVLAAACGDPAVPPAARAGLELVGEPVVLTKQGGLREAVGRVRNTDTEPRSGVVEVTLFGADGKVVGTANGLVSNVRPGEEATYNGAINPAVPAVTRLEARAGAQYRVKT